jgi:hypothetical protein
MTTLRRHEIGALEHAGDGLPRPATALAVWRLIRRPMKLRRMSALVSTAHGLSPAVRSVLKVRALQSLTIGLDCAVQAGHAGRQLTTNLFVEALAARWSETYRAARACGSSRLHDFKPETVVAVREELVGQGVAYQRVWKAVREGVPGLYRTSPPIKNRGRAVSVADREDRPFPLLADFDRLLDGDRRYRRDAIRGPRLLLADDPAPPRRIAQRIAGEMPFDVMSIGDRTENVLQRLEATRVILRVPDLLSDIEETKKRLAESPWPAASRQWRDGLRARFAAAGLGLPVEPREDASGEVKYWAAVARLNIRHARKAFRIAEWEAFLSAPGRRTDRDRYRTLRGRLLAMRSIRDQLRERGIADTANVELKSTFFKHRTRRYQAVNVWPSEASAGEERVYEFVDPELGAAVARLAARLYGAPEVAPTGYAVSQRIRWFGFPGEPAAPDGMYGLDVSGSQAQILAVAMGLRSIEDQLREKPFKEIVAASIAALHREGKLRAPEALLNNPVWLENTAKDVAMPALYGGRPSNLARNTQRDPDRCGPGVSQDVVEALFKNDSTLKSLRAFLDVAEAVGRAACAADPAGGVTAVDPLDQTAFTWNPPVRRKTAVSSGAFKLYVWPPVLTSDGRSRVDEQKLIRRIAPGLIHELDALFAAAVVVCLNHAGVRDVVSIHDAFLIPTSAHRDVNLDAVLDAAARVWLPLLGPFYDVFDRYLPATSPDAEAARGWRRLWERRVADCEAGTDEWPRFRTKYEGAEYR